MNFKALLYNNELEEHIVENILAFSDKNSYNNNSPLAYHIEILSLENKTEPTHIMHVNKAIYIEASLSVQC